MSIEIRGSSSSGEVTVIASGVCHRRRAASGIEPHRLEWSFEVQTSWAPQRRKASTPISIDRFAAHRQIRLVAAFLPGLPSHCLKLVRFPNWFLRFLIVIDSGLEISVFSASPSPSSQSQWSLRAKLPISDEYSVSSAYAWSTAHTRVLSRAFVRIIEIKAFLTNNPHLPIWDHDLGLFCSHDHYHTYMCAG